MTRRRSRSGSCRSASGCGRWMLHALFRLAAYYTTQVTTPAGSDHTTRLLALEPWHEEVHQQMMLLLALSGQRSAALNQFEVCRRLLADELGVQPTPTPLTASQDCRGEVTAQPAFAPLPRDWPWKPRPSWAGRGTGATDAYLAARQPSGDGGWHQRGGQDTPGPAGLLRRSGSSAGCTLYVGSRATTPRDSLTLSCVCSLCPDGSAECRTQLISHLQDREVLIIIDHLDRHPAFCSSSKN